MGNVITMLLAIIILILVMLVPAIIYKNVSYRGEMKNFVLISILAYIVGILILIFLAHTSNQEINFSFQIMNLNLLFSSLILILIQILAPYIHKRVFKKEMDNQNTMQVVSVIKKKPLYALVPVVLAPIIEELVFRLFLIGILTSNFNIYTAIIVSSLIFAFMHSIKNFIYMFLISVVLSASYLISGNLLIPIISHMIMNFYVIVSLKYKDRKIGNRHY